MSAPVPVHFPTLDSQTARLLEEFAVGQAAECARRGSADRADSLLRPLLERTDPPVSALDLQARLCAQQGRLAEAERWWLKVLEKEPNHAAAQAGLARLRALQRQPVWLQWLWPPLVGLLVLGCGAGLLLWQARWHGVAHAALEQRMSEALSAQGQTARQEAQALLSEVRALSRQGQEQDSKLHELARGLELLSVAGSNQVSGLGLALENRFRRAVEQELASAQEQFRQQFAALEAETRNHAVRAAAAEQALSSQVAAWRQAMDHERALRAELDQSRQKVQQLQVDHQALAADYQRLLAEAERTASPPDLAIAVPGVRTMVSGRAVVVSFEEGLFDHGTHFRPSAKARLCAVAQSLSRHPQPLHIQIVGHADDDRPFLKWTPRWAASLALARASAVADWFLETGWFRPEQIAASASGRLIRPSRYDHPDECRRNRTVTLRLTRLAAHDVENAECSAEGQPAPQTNASIR